MMRELKGRKSVLFFSISFFESGIKKVILELITVRVNAANGLGLCAK